MEVEFEVKVVAFDDGGTKEEDNSFEVKNSF